MRTELLTLVQWLSPAFPVSAYAYSHGLEAAVAEGWVADGPGLGAWLGDVLRHGAGRSDAIWMRLGHAAADATALDRLDAEARAFAASAERIEEAARQGAGFTATVRAVWQIEMPDVLLPLAVGHAAARAGIDIEDVVPLALQAFAANMVGAGQRLMPLGQTAAQGILAALQPAILAVAGETEGAGEDDIASCAFLSDIAAMRHETQTVRIFRT